MVPVHLIAAAVDTIETTTTSEVDNAAAAGILGVFGAFMIIWVLLAIVGFVYWLWMLIDSIKTTDEEYAKIGSGSKIMWILLILILGILPAIIYHVMVKRKVKALSAPSAPAAPEAK